MTRAEVDLLIYDWEFHDLIKEVLKKIADGKIDAYSAFLSGDIQVEGNLRKELLAKVLRQ